MKLEYSKDMKVLIARALLGVSVVLGVIALVKVGAFFAASARAETLVKNAAAQNKLSEKEIEKYFAKPRAIADALKKKNLFVPPPPKEQPIKQVSGILGDEALINGKWHKAGDMVAGAKILAIEPAQIKFEWDGKEIVLAPIKSASPPGPGGEMPGAADAGAKGGPMPPRGPVERGPTPGRRGPGMFRNLSPQERAELRERMKNMSKEEREKFRAEMR